MKLIEIFSSIIFCTWLLLLCCSVSIRISRHTAIVLDLLVHFQWSCIERFCMTDSIGFGPPVFFYIFLMLRAPSSFRFESTKRIFTVDIRVKQCFKLPFFLFIISNVSERLSLLFFPIVIPSRNRVSFQTNIARSHGQLIPVIAIVSSMYFSRAFSTALPPLFPGLNMHWQNSVL